MSDNTIVQQGSGGDTVRTDDVGPAKIQVVKIATGLSGVDGGVVGRNNPLPVVDFQSRELLEKILFTLESILSELHKGEI